MPAASTKTSGITASPATSAAFQRPRPGPEPRYSETTPQTASAATTGLQPSARPSARADVSELERACAVRRVGAVERRRDEEEAAFDDRDGECRQGEAQVELAPRDAAATSCAASALTAIGCVSGSSTALTA